MMTYPVLPLLQFPLLFQSSAPFLLRFNQIALKRKELFFFSPSHQRAAEALYRFHQAALARGGGGGWGGASARVAAPSPGLRFPILPRAEQSYF